MMRKTAKSRSTESSAAAERLADYKGDVSFYIVDTMLILSVFVYDYSTCV